jgi:CRISPR/Cas system-associated exonuclease Cas4 (RecB family)
MIALVVLAAVILLLVGLLLRRQSAPPVDGELVYNDTNKRAVTAPINSRVSGLTGKPDYVYRKGMVSIPIEVKKRLAGRFGPRASDVAQLMAYCVLLEDAGETVFHGAIEYSDKRFPIPYGPEARRKVLQAAEAIRAERRAGTADRDHQDVWRCRSCGVRESCAQRLR